MKMREFDNSGERSWVLALDDGEEAVGTLLDFARQIGITAARFTGLGAFSEVTLGFFDFQKKDYHRNCIAQQVEVASLIGDVAMHGDEVKLHAHIVVAKRDATALGGHLLEGRVHPTLEILLTQSPDHLRRRTDPETGLALLAPTAE